MKKIRITIAAILAALVLLAGCADIAGPVTAGSAPGMGRALVSIGPQGAKTLMPVDYSGVTHYTLTFSSGEKTVGPVTITGTTHAEELEAGTWELTVTGKDAGDTNVLEGRVTGIVITAGATANVPVTLAAFTESGTGTLSYAVTLPAGVTKGTLTVYDWGGETAKETIDLLASATGNLTLPAGYHRIALDLFKADGVFRRTDIAQIYPGLTTQAAYTVAAGEFVGAEVVGGQTSLAAVLTAISGLSSGDDKTFLLPAGNEAMAATSVSNSSGPVTVAIDGGGRIVTLNDTGSLITVGDNVTLVLTNITLRGQGIDSGDPGNNAALLAVESGGKLELGTGAWITANKSSSNGGGVYVGSSGTFAMSGGEISGNTVSRGGGVYVDSAGIFTMSGGEISGNAASGSSGGGGGVYANGFFTMNDGKILGNTSFIDGGGALVTGTFIMNGGEISGNTISYGNGGGVRVVAGRTFTMNGGEISGNTGAQYGGGVYVNATGNLIMNGGEISGNTASSGGGVLIENGVTFTMNDGKISGNMSNNGGGGVYASGYVDYAGGIFTMSGGEISGNTSSDGGGVYISFNGAFIMSGGGISGNTATSYGDGVYVSRTGNFTISGEARVNVNNAVYLHYSPSIITIGGSFTGPAGPVAMIDLYENSDWSSRAALKLASGYSGNLASLKSRFALGHFIDEYYDTVTPITDYGIADDGTLEALSKR